MQTILRDWLIGFRDDQQRKIRRPDADAKCLAGGDHAGEQSRQSGYPFQVGVAVIGPALKERDSSGGGELRSMVQLQARVGEVRALFRTDCLPSLGVGRSAALFLRLKFHKYIQSEASSAYED
jgi:hypothetical protein